MPLEEYPDSLRLGEAEASTGQITVDPKPKSRLIKANLRLVVKIAVEFYKYSLKNLMDLIQEGNLGFMQAFDRFDPSVATAVFELSER